MFLFPLCVRTQIYLHSGQECVVFFQLHNIQNLLGIKLILEKAPLYSISELVNLCME